MPTYEYRCKECSHDFEIVQAFTDDALTECPQCAGPLRKVFGNVGISFKGSGFYKTDHGSKAGSGGSRDNSDSSSSGTGDTAAKTDTATKADPPAKSESGTKSESTAA